MSQVFIWGASTVYGSGGGNGGWANMVKQALHEQMFAPGGSGEEYQVYNFGKPGADIKFVQDTYAEQLARYRDPGRVVAVISVGLNNTKASGTPGNFVCSPEDYCRDMHNLLAGIKQQADAVLAVGYAAVDESKMPLTNELYGKSYFSNERIVLFNAAFQMVCRQLGVYFVGVYIAPALWAAHCLYQDGLHPNSQGHEQIFQKVMPQIQRVL
jgi:lysophospholipase L1-like esterase